MGRGSGQWELLLVLGQLKVQCHEAMSFTVVREDFLKQSMDVDFLVEEEDVCYFSHEDGKSRIEHWPEEHQLSFGQYMRQMVPFVRI